MPAKNRRPRSRHHRERRGAATPPQHAAKRKTGRNPTQPSGKSWQDRFFSLGPTIIALVAAIINHFKS